MKSSADIRIKIGHFWCKKLDPNFRLYILNLLIAPTGHQDISVRQRPPHETERSAAREAGRFWGHQSHAPPHPPRAAQAGGGLDTPQRAEGHSHQEAGWYRYF